jgi:apocytochrome f
MILKSLRVQILAMGLLLGSTLPSEAYPIFAQQNYATPREATGRIVCANCHLAKKVTDIEIPHEVFPDTVFETVVKIPYDVSVKQVLGNGKTGGLNVGAVVIFPEGFELAPADRMPAELQAKTKGLFFSPYSADQPNMFVIGPIPGKRNQEISFPILSPNPATNKQVDFLKYPVYVGGNRGRGQIYPDGSKSNNNLFTAELAGKITDITVEKKVGRTLSIETANGEIETQVIPNGPELLVKVGDVISVDQQITVNPNVGGFGQTESEIVLQNPMRLQGLIVFFISVFLAQVFLVLKKKQFEKVQLSEMNF